VALAATDTRCYCFRVMSTRVALLCGHRYGSHLAGAIATAAQGIDFVHAFVLHPSNVHRYGGYESPIGVLEKAGVKYTFFNEMRELNNWQVIRKYRPHYIFVCGLRQIIPTEMLWDLARENDDFNIFSERGGFVCFHPSNLPDGAGLAPVQWTIFERSRESVVSCFFIDDIQIDGGPVIHQRGFLIDPDEDAHSLDRKIGAKVAESFLDMAPDIAARRLKFQPQNMLAGSRRVRPQIDNRERWLDFNDNVERVLLRIRAFTKPYGGIAALINDRPLLVYGAKREPAFHSDDLIGRVSADGSEFIVHCADGAIRLTSFEFLD
jgi:methionyl-tRNA formyltransferase